MTLPPQWRACAEPGCALRAAPIYYPRHPHAGASIRCLGCDHHTYLVISGDDIDIDIARDAIAYDPITWPPL